MEMLFPKHQQHHHPLLYPLSITCLALVSLLTIPSILVIGRQVRGRVSKNYFYEDRDGKSEPEAVAAFCNRKPKAAILLFSLAGFGTSVAVTVLIAIDSRRGEVLENGLVTSSWVRHRKKIRRRFSFLSYDVELTVTLPQIGSYRSPSRHTHGSSCSCASAQYWLLDLLL